MIMWKSVVVCAIVSMFSWMVSESNADAAVLDFQISSSGSFHDYYDVGCEYELVAKVDNPEAFVVFTDNGKPVAPPDWPINIIGGPERVAIVKWTPDTIGQHRLVATQNGVSKTVDAFVFICPASACM